MTIVDFRLSKNLLNAFESQNTKKNSKFFILPGCSISFLKSWIEFQLSNDMTLENYGSVWHIDPCIAISSFNLLDENEMRKCFNWLN